MTVPTLDSNRAARFADIALANVVREYPGKPDHVISADSDLLPPRVLHPAFYGSYDWHSCVHMHWLLARIRRLQPNVPQREKIDALLDHHLASPNIEVERAYLDRPDAGAFERPYGWTWLLKLADELVRSDDPQARRWSGQLEPLAKAFVDRYHAWLAKVDYPVRHGVHSNSAFGVLFALDYARTVGDAGLSAAIQSRARAWFGSDRAAPAQWEPSGFDFLSPSLVEADLVRRVLPAVEFAAWLDDFLPGFGQREPATLFTPVAVSDRADGHIVHLDGLNLSRAWCLRSLATAFAAGDPRAMIARDAADAHLAAGLIGLDAASYAGSHWLASFAALALSEPQAPTTLRARGTAAPGGSGVGGF
jgi:hypothetical protein